MPLVNGRSFRLALAFALVPLAAHAQDARQALDGARRNLERRRTADAQQAVDALIQGGGLPPAELAEAYEIQGLAFVAAGDNASAEGAFTTMLSVEASREPQGRYALDASEALVSARTARGEAGQLRIDAGMDEAWRRGVAPVVSVGVFGDAGGMVARLDLYYRPAGQIDFGVKTVQGAGPHRIEMTLMAGMQPQPIEYYAEAFDDFGNQLVTRGASEAADVIDPNDVQTTGATAPVPVPPPVQTRPTQPQLSAAITPPVGGGDAWQMSGGDGAEPEDDDGAITSKWWFWGGLAAVGVGAIAGIVALSSGGGGEPAGGGSGSGCFGDPCDWTVGPPP